MKALSEMLEIERRFLVDGREAKPWRRDARVLHIQQHYVPFEPFSIVDGALHGFGLPLTAMTEEQARVWNSTRWVIRLRKMNEDHILTCKSRQRHDASLELEWPLREDDYRLVLSKGPFPHVIKTRYEWIAEDGNVWEVDEFEGALAGVVLAEIELEDSHQEFTPPSWIGQEITGLDSWSNNALSKMIDHERIDQD